jgi:hypothetical protein
MTSKHSVLVLAEKQDIHALAFRGLARQLNIDVDIIDSKDLADDFSLSFVPDEQAAFLQNGTTHRLEEYSGVWWRRPRTPRPPISLRDATKNVTDFCSRETQAAFHGMFLTYNGNIVNHPEHERTASNKLLQLSLAKKCGLQIPRTCVTSCPEIAREFTRSNDRKVIYKVLTHTAFQFTPTRSLDEGIELLLDSVRLCPVILQERVDSIGDLRVTVVDDKVFTARIRGIEGILDWREEIATAVEPAELPDEETQSLLRFMKKLNLRYGAADFRVRADGTPVFLEVNPAGQYLFVELETGFPITEALLTALTKAQPSDCAYGQTVG